MITNTGVISNDTDNSAKLKDKSRNIISKKLQNS